ncbi:NADP-dependent oxidoreductase [Burkholderia sp. 22PA0099]|uniref:NADP-dependent oxidoreductase n=1 Tax=Burkholderia sp. 22PA0099 TaxID=3237372 RepID=UPI0039C0A098
MQSLRFHRFGEPSEVLRLEAAEVPAPRAGQIRVAVRACGLTPADWALCKGLFPGALPRGIGLEVAGTVDAVGEGVTGIAIGDRVLGVPDYVGTPVAGASEFCLLDHWAPIADTLGYAEAAALPMAVETAYRSLDQLGVTAGTRLLVHGAGTTVGFAAVQIALLRGAQVFATAGRTYADTLRALGASVTAYGDGMAERVLALAGGPLDLALDTAPVNVSSAVAGALPALIEAVGGEPRRVLTIVDFDGAAKLGVRTSFDSDPGATLDETGMPVLDADATARLTGELRYDVLGEFAQRAAAGQFSVPIARAFPLAQWRDALAASQSGFARGKLILLVGDGA